jgi:hypothetical protein
MSLASSASYLPLTATTLPNGNVRLANPDGTTKCVFPSDHSRKPTRRNKYVRVNCFTYRIEWV